MFDLAKEIWQTMTTNKLRTILTGVSVAWGIFMLILLLSIANGVVRQSQEQSLRNDPFRISVWSGYTSRPYQGMKMGRRINFKGGDISAFDHTRSPYIESVSGTISLSGQISTPRDYLTQSSSEGVFPKDMNQRYKIVQGRWINQADINDCRKVVLLCENDAKILFEDIDHAIGQTVKIGNAAFTLVGIYSHGWDESPKVPFSTAYALNGFDGRIYGLDAHLKDVETVEQSAEAEKEVRKILADKHRFDPEDQSAVHTYDRFESYISSMESTKYLTYAMWTIGILTLLTGIVGVSNIMFVSVRERTHEIGIRRAIGAKPRKILSQIIIESVALTTCFGYIGIVMGVAATEIVKKVFENNEQFPISPTVDIVIAIEVTIALIIAGALAGIFPAIRALKVKPVEALMEE
ncbi:MAG: ABC transporter permease [Clostridium sp.]|nr:ABC transporter permease [Clostridium sp.]